MELGRDTGSARNLSVNSMVQNVLQDGMVTRSIVLIQNHGTTAVAVVGDVASRRDDPALPIYIFKAYTQRATPARMTL